MTIVAWIMGFVLSVWIGAMGVGSLLGTKTAKTWFDDMLEQSPLSMKINGIGFLIAALFIFLNLFAPEYAPDTSVKWALAGMFIAQLASLFMQVRGNAPGAARVGTIVLMVLIIIYWFLLAG